LREEGGWRDVTIVPDAIASREGEATLHVTRKPGMSSLLRPDPEVYKRYAATKPYAVQSRQAVRTVRLDTAAERHGFRDACFVKVDTQGTELDILRSGERLMRESVLGVYTEALFHPFYEGQSLFADLDAHLRGLGFVLFDLDRTLRRGSGHPTALYSRRQVVWAHCLYLREPGAVATQSPPDVRRLARYVSLALAHQHVDAALRVIEDEHAGPLLEERCGPGLAGAVGAYAGARTAQRLAGLSDEQAAAELSASAHDSRRG
jgi:FkbM family methyltransferase